MSRQVTLQFRFGYRSDKQRRRKPRRASRWKTRLGKWCHRRRWFIGALMKLLAILASLLK